MMTKKAVIKNKAEKFVKALGQNNKFFQWYDTIKAMRGGTLCMEDKKTKSWFWKLVINNKLVSVLIVILLCLLIIAMAKQVSWFFQPVFQFITIIGAPILVSGVLYYLFAPIIDWAERKLHLSRTLAIISLFLIVILLIAWGAIHLVPEIQHQFYTLSRNIPHYWSELMHELESLFKSSDFNQLKAQLESINKDIYTQLGNIGKHIFSNGFSGLSSMVSVVASIVVTVITVPFILFYLLRDGKQLVPFIMRYLPPKFRKSIQNVLSDINDKVSSYIRGQIIVAISVAIIYMIGFSIVGLDYAIALGTLAGFFNIIPYIGSWLTMIPVVIIALVTGGPLMLIKVLCVHLIEQVIEGHVLDPIVIGSQMAIHPLTIIFVLLTAGKLFGILGVILGIPGYATIKVIVVHIYNWYRDNSALFAETVEQKE